MRKLVTMNILLLMTLKLSAQNVEIGQLSTDTLFFNSTQFLIDTVNDNKIKLIANRIKENENMDYTILACSCKGKKQINWNRRYYCYEKLIRKYNVKQTQLRLYDISDCCLDCVIIRESNEIERATTNCGVPLFPELKR